MAVVAGVAVVVGGGVLDIIGSCACIYEYVLTYSISLLFLVFLLVVELRGSNSMIILVELIQMSILY